MRSHSLTILTLFITISSLAQNPAPPLVDGKCQEYKGLNAQVIELDHEVKLHFYQDEHFVWICYCYQDGSYGTLDLQIEAPGLNAPLNLHVSAQIGEWPVNEPEAAPKDPLSDKWWNHIGWIANEVWPNGIDRSEERASPRFKNAEARELQLSKSRFGKGDWKMKFNIRALNTGDGMASLNFPEGDDPFILQVN